VSCVQLCTAAYSCCMQLAHSACMQLTHSVREVNKEEREQVDFV
jgi:hypothetical protein